VKPLILSAHLLLASLAGLYGAEAPVSHRVLCTDYKGNRVAILAANGDIEWEFPAKTPQDCWLLPNGNVLFSQITGAVEVTMDKKVVWEYKAPPKALVHSCQPLPDGTVLVAECVTGRIVLVGREGEVLKEMPVQSSPKVAAHQFRGARRTSDGHYWVCLMDEKKVVELDANGAQLREVAFDGHPGEVVKLPDGHILVSLWDKTSIVELDENLQTVWQISENEIPGNPLRIPMGMHRLPNGNTLIGNYLGHGFEGRQPMVFEVDREKKTVWEFADHARFRTVCQMQVLDVPANAAKGEVLR
jgi:hypothetical protein